ncbi:MAG TPA: efflux RND transporter periplasmic adaptor subunit [Chthoniobacteraceae bacterium]
MEPETTRRSPVGLLLLGAIVLVAGLVIGIIPRLRANGALKEQTEALSIPTVNFIEPRAKKQDNAFVLPGEVRPFVETPIYARTNGYLKRWSVDIGAEVKAGDLLAEIDTPDLDQQLANAAAQALQAEAAAELAKTTAVRYNKLRKTATISDQDADERNSDADAKEASAEAARASVRRFKDLQNFQKVTAPFDGTITQRNTDVGQLVDSTGAHSLFQLTQSHTLRVFVRAPESEVSSIAVGQKAKVSFPEFPGRKFEAKVVRTAGAIDLTSRTLLTELELDNAKGEVLPGSHAEVQFAISEDKPILMLPSNALLFRSEGPQAGVVDASGKVQLRSLGLGRDFGRELEILTGISEGEHVILNPADSLMDGAVVRAVPAKVAPAAAVEKPATPGA